MSVLGHIRKAITETKNKKKLKKKKQAFTIAEKALLWKSFIQQINHCQAEEFTWNSSNALSIMSMIKYVCWTKCPDHCKRSCKWASGNCCCSCCCCFVVDVVLVIIVIVFPCSHLYPWHGEESVSFNYNNNTHVFGWWTYQIHVPFLCPL